VQVYREIYLSVTFCFSLFLAALNSTTKPRCRGCTAGYYCPGDGTEKRCGESSPTEYSEGAAANCSACPEGKVGEMFLCYERGECRLGITTLVTVPRNDVERVHLLNIHLKLQ